MGNYYLQNYSGFDIIWQIIVLWYWVPLPFILFMLFRNAWLWWRREVWDSKQKYILLEMMFPAESEKPFFTMEHVLSTVWSIYSNTNGLKNFKKRWIIGKRLIHFCFEIVSKGPHPRFFIYANRDHIDSIETAFYSQYPDMEFVETKEDYIKEMPFDVPNSEWDFYGMDQTLGKNDSYPIKTYKQFFEMKPENVKEEKRVDPMSTLLEGLNHLHEDEQSWIQIRVAPVSELDNSYRKRGQKLVNKLIHRKEKGGKGIVAEALDTFAGSGGNSKHEELIPPEMKLTPRERQIVEEIENKMGKNVFQTNIRVMHFGPKKNFNPGRRGPVEEFFSSFSMPDLNIFKKLSTTKTKIQHIWIKRRLFGRKRRIFRRYIMRETPLYPRTGGTFVLSTEELATIFHPPMEIRKIGTLVARVDSKKGEAPVNLPID